MRRLLCDFEDDDGDGLISVFVEDGFTGAEIQVHCGVVRNCNVGHFSAKELARAFRRMARELDTFVKGAQ